MSGAYSWSPGIQRAWAAFAFLVLPLTEYTTCFVGSGGLYFITAVILSDICLVFSFISVYFLLLLIQHQFCFFKKKLLIKWKYSLSVPIRTCIHWVVCWSPDNVNDKLTFSLKIYLFLLYVYGDFVYIYVCVSCVCSGPVETSRRHQIPGTCSWKCQRPTIRVLEIKLGFSTRESNT